MRTTGAWFAVGLALVGLWTYEGPVFSAAPGSDEVTLHLDTSQRSAGRQELSFTLIDAANGQSVTPGNLEIIHERKLHVFILDEGLQELRHEHPEFVTSSWRLIADLPRSGRYRVFAQGQLLDGREFVGEGDLSIIDGLPAHPAPPVLREIRDGADRGSRVSLKSGRLRAGRMVMLTVGFSRENGTRPEIQPWLGAMLHAAIVPQNLLAASGSLIHAHPMEHGGELMLHAVFPKSGMYRVWVQFQDAGVIRTVPLAVKVEP